MMRSWKGFGPPVEFDLYTLGAGGSSMSPGGNGDVMFISNHIGDTGAVAHPV